MSELQKKENYLNEVKGHLFEYTVGRFLAEENAIEKAYYDQMPSTLKSLLEQYQEILYRGNKGIYTSLIPLAQKVAFEVFDFLRQKYGNKTQIKAIDLVGKNLAEAKDDRFKEADLLLQLSESSKAKGITIPLSLKLAKKAAFINSKNAGIKSFFTKYFSSFEEAPFFQNELDLLSHQFFAETVLEMHELLGLPVKSHFDGHFIEKVQTELPGELPRQLQDCLYQYYYKTVALIHSQMEKLFKKNPSAFLRSLLPLAGLSTEDMLQVSCFYGEALKLHSVHITDATDLDLKLDDVVLGALEPNRSFFYVTFLNFQLQIRLKPMNKYTVEGLKVNCSIKYLS